MEPAIIVEHQSLNRHREESASFAMVLARLRIIGVNARCNRL